VTLNAPAAARSPIPARSKLPGSGAGSVGGSVAPLEDGSILIIPGGSADGSTALTAAAGSAEGSDALAIAAVGSAEGSEAAAIAPVGSAEGSEAVVVGVPEVGSEVSVDGLGDIMIIPGLVIGWLGEF
jgi:hypothetical protein